MEEDLNSTLSTSFLEDVGLIKKLNQGGLVGSHSLKPDNIG